MVDDVEDQKDAEIIEFPPELNTSGMPPLDLMTQNELRNQLVASVEGHSALEARLIELQQQSPVNMIDIARTKKNKLLLKDRIQSIKAKLLPDIIA